MSDFVLAIPWQDRCARGVQGVVEIHQSDLEHRRQEESQRRLSDQDDVEVLIEVLNKKLAKKDGGSHLVEAIWLYGTKLDTFRLLTSIIPVVLDGCPRLVAKTEFVLESECGITVKHLTGETGFIAASIDNLKYKIMERWGIPVHEQRLIYEGKQLDDGRTLGDYKLENRSVLYVVLRIRGGGPGPTRRFVDVWDHSNLHEHNLSSTAPDWRICDEGLNIEGECENRECDAFGEMVICQNAFDSFNLMGDKNVRCPRCYKAFKPITCGFYECVWKFEGVRSSDGFFISSPWRDAGGSKYHRFDADENCASVEWDSLLIVVKSRRESTAAKVPVSTRSSLVRKGNVCSICWSWFGSTSRSVVVAAQCGHSFHRVCLGTWSKWCRGNDTLPRCPLCRNAAVVDEADP